MRRYRRELAEAYGVGAGRASAVPLSPPVHPRAQARRRCAAERSAQARRCPAGRKGLVRQPRARAGGDRRGSRARRRRSRAQGLARRSRRTPRSRPARAHPWASRGGLKLAAGARRLRARSRAASPASTSAPRPAASPTCCSRAARAASSPSTSATASSTPRLAADPRVTLARRPRRARADARTILREPPQAIVCDVSFISQRLVLPSVLALAARPAWLVSLVKPQFEVGPRKAGQGRRSRTTRRSRQACEEVRACVEALGWTSLGLIHSPMPGGDGAREFLYAARHG